LHCFTLCNDTSVPATLVRTPIRFPCGF
jgi:hypothetical protein